MNPDLKTPSTDSQSESGQEVKIDSAPIAETAEQPALAENPAKKEEPASPASEAVSVSPAPAAEATGEPKLSSNVVDLRTPESEAEKAAAEEAKQKALEEQANQSAVIAANNVGDIKAPTAQLSENDPAIDTSAQSLPGQPANSAEPQANASNVQPAKKPGFFSRLFGKK